MDASVIIPTYNAEKIIKPVINALLSQQTKKTFEIIVVDDGSSDETAQEVKKIKSKKLVYLHQKNTGPAKARNAGAKCAKGKIILFIDSDCVAEKAWLTEMLKPFNDKRVSAVQGAYKTKQKELTARFGQIEIENRYEKMNKAQEIDWVGSYSAAYDKKVYDSLGGFDESFPIASGEDPELSYKVHERGGKIVFNPKAIVYHTHPASLGKYLKVKFFRAFYRPKMYSKHKAKMLKDSYTPQSLKLQILCFYAIVLSLIISAIFTDFIFITSAFVVLHILLGTKFFAFAWKKNKTIALASILILFLRSIVFGIGLIWGKLRG
jgi:glycosyltransferase involved in cell wall biosynthesis